MLGSADDAGGRLWLTLAADARFGRPDFFDDQIWELQPSAREPLALVCQTSFGLRARSLSLFPAFSRDGGGWLMDPAAFAEPPELEIALPNYARLRLRPWPGLSVTAEYWVPESHVLAGRLHLANPSDQMQSVRLRLHAVLQPAEGAEVMHRASFNGVTVLSGRTMGLAPVVFLSGGAALEPAAYPGLGLQLAVEPGETLSVTWAHAGLREPEASFNLARSTSERPWDSEVAALELANAGWIRVDSGRPAWDAAFQRSQNLALGSLMGPSRYLPYPWPVASRRPDQGFSPRGDGRDYPAAWAGGSAELAMMAVPLLQWAAPSAAKGLICDFVHNPMPDGGIDSRPGLSGLRSGVACAPIVAGLAWGVYQVTEDADFLRKVRGPLVGAVRAWFGTAHDRDGDGFPEWDHTPQAMNDDSPTFAVWHRWGQGLAIDRAETPDLAAYLLQECTALLAMGQVLEAHQDDGWLTDTCRQLTDRLDQAWSETAGLYLPVDRDEHVSPAGQDIVHRQGAFTYAAKHVFDPPARLIVRCFGPEAASSKLKVRLFGRAGRGRSRIERLSPGDFQWFWEFGTATSSRNYSELTKIEVSGLDDGYEIEVRTADFTRPEATGLLPLWAGVPDPVRARAMVTRNLLDPRRFWRRFGIPRVPADDPGYDPDKHLGAFGVRLPLNVMLAQGMLRYGYRREAAHMFERLMETLVNTLDQAHGFRGVYHPDRAGGGDARDELLGAAPLGLFMDLLGVRLIAPWKVRLEGRSPFDDPVTLRWRGLTLTRSGDQTELTFPNGQHASARGEAPTVVEQART
jgi:hypothetical protein